MMIENSLLLPLTQTYPGTIKSMSPGKMKMMIRYDDGEESVEHAPFVRPEGWSPPGEEGQMTVFVRQVPLLSPQCSMATGPGWDGPLAAVAASASRQAGGGGM